MIFREIFIITFPHAGQMHLSFLKLLAILHCLHLPLSQTHSYRQTPCPIMPKTVVTWHCQQKTLLFLPVFIKASYFVSGLVSSLPSIDRISCGRFLKTIIKYYSYLHTVIFIYYVLDFQLNKTHLHSAAGKCIFKHCWNPQYTQRCK